MLCCPHFDSSRWNWECVAWPSHQCLLKSDHLLSRALVLTGNGTVKGCSSSCSMRRPQMMPRDRVTSKLLHSHLQVASPHSHLHTLVASELWLVNHIQIWATRAPWGLGLSTSKGICSAFHPVAQKWEERGRFLTCESDSIIS